MYLRPDATQSRALYFVAGGLAAARPTPSNNHFTLLLMTTSPLRTPIPSHQDIIVLIPLKLAFIYLLLPSLMRHRMRPDMFTRIPRHAPSVQVARRHPDMQVMFWACGFAWPCPLVVVGRCVFNFIAEAVSMFVLARENTPGLHD